MSKFYVQCGSFQFLTAADEARSAALIAFHHYLSERVELNAIDWQCPSTIDNELLIEAMLNLEEVVSVSESGFNDKKSMAFQTADVMTEWNQLAVAICRLEQEMFE